MASRLGPPDNVLFRVTASVERSSREWQLAYAVGQLPTKSSPDGDEESPALSFEGNALEHFRARIPLTPFENPDSRSKLIIFLNKL